MREDLKGYRNIVFFGGSGTSTECGIPDFRSAKGLFSMAPESILSHTTLINNPEIFFKFCRENLYYPDSEPVEGHFILKDLEERGLLKAIITQNIDSMHQKAGSKNVVELHGTLIKNYCITTGEEFSMEYVLNYPEIIPRCDKCGDIVRPDVVLYEEQLDYHSIERAIKYLEEADLLILCGSSFVVQPACSLIFNSKARKILINLEATPIDNYVDEVMRMGFSQGLKLLFK